MSGHFLDRLKVGNHIAVNGPFGLIEYIGNGVFNLPGRKGAKFDHVGMMAGGSGVTPMLQILQAVDRENGGAGKNGSATSPTFSLLYANKTEDDILCKDMLNGLAKTNENISMHYTIDYPPSGWSHFTGFITTDMIEKTMPKCSERTLILLCGPPPMVQYACKDNLQKLGFDLRKNVASF
jgi:NAD(P)H-flavin reductase